MARVQCYSGRYVHPQFTLEEGDISPEIDQKEAERIASDFPESVEMVEEVKVEEKKT